MRVYADTSVFGGVFDSEFSTPSNQFFQEVEQNNFILVTSAVVEAEIEPAPENIRHFFKKYAQLSEVVVADGAAFDLQQKYIEAGIVTKKSLDDALHVALATISQCTIIVSWNFKHIVHFDKIPKYNAVNTLNGYGNIGIYSPLEVIQYGNA